MSMVLSGIPDPQAQLRSLQQELYNRNRQISEAEARIADLEAELVRERAKSRQVERGSQQLRSVLTPLYHALGAVFGELDAVAPETTSTAASASSHPVWESWKAKVSAGEAKAIDALLLHGTLSVTQLRIHIGCASRTAYNIVGFLKSKGLIVREGDKVRLKELS